MGTLIYWYIDTLVHQYIDILLELGHTLNYLCTTVTVNSNNNNNNNNVFISTCHIDNTQVDKCLQQLLVYCKIMTIKYYRFDI